MLFLVELTFLQNQLNAIATQAALLASMSFYTVNIQVGSNTSLGYHTQIIATVFGSLALIFSLCTLFSAVFANMWGSTEALRARNEVHLRKALLTFREERDFAVRLFTYSVVCVIFSTMAVGFLYWHEDAGMMVSVLMTIGLWFLFIVYNRVRSRFLLTPTIFHRGFLREDFYLFAGMWSKLSIDYYKPFTPPKRPKVRGLRSESKLSTSVPHTADGGASEWPVASDSIHDSSSHQGPLACETDMGLSSGEATSPDGARNRALTSSPIAFLARARQHRRFLYSEKMGDLSTNGHLSDNPDVNPVEIAGWLTKKCSASLGAGDKWKIFHFRLANHVLQYFDSLDNDGYPIGQLELANQMITVTKVSKRGEDDLPHQFIVSIGVYILHLRADTEEQLDDWVRMLRRYELGTQNDATPTYEEQRESQQG